jgi:hypothetical protein
MSSAPAVVQSAVHIVIVNYRTADLVIDCLRSLEPEVRSIDGVQVTVVDNRSDDGSIERLRSCIDTQGWSGWARLLASPVNGGFAYGNNEALRALMAAPVAPRYCWLLNSDTVVHPGALRALVEFMEAHPNCGIAGGALQNADGSEWPFAFRFPTLLGELERGMRLGLLSRLLRRHIVAQRMPTDRPVRVDWVPGASMMIRFDVLAAVGLMDEDYFLYYEETDYCLQAERAGWQTWYVPASRVVHIAGQSTGVTGAQAQLRRLPSYWFNSRRRYFVKNHGRVYAAACDSVWLLSFLGWRLRRRLQSKADLDPPALLADFVRHSALLNAGLPTNPAIAGMPHAKVWKPAA